ncbi:MAG: LuxR C-terminal-related transcriptional regulator [Cyanobium sp.]
MPRPTPAPAGGEPCSTAQLLRCVVVEDQVMFLQLLVAMLRGQPGIDVVGTALSVAEGKALCLELRPDLLIFDLLLPVGRGLEVAEALVAVAPAARLIVLSGEAGSFVCPAPLRPALCAVVDKTRAYGTLSQEIAALCRQTLDSGSSAGTDDPWPRQDPPGESLTAREREIFRLIGRGLSNREIAASLHLSPRTVETHRKNIVAKLGVSGLDLVRLAALELPPLERPEADPGTDHPAGPGNQAGS